MLNFKKNRKLYIEHVIYTLHFQSFVFLSLFVASFVKVFNLEIVNTIIGFIISIIIIWYSYKSLRVFYQRSIVKTIWKMFGLLFLYFIAFIFSYQIIFFISEKLH